jgi:uncharacterized protein YndB with AHSA1/START domain
VAHAAERICSCLDTVVAWTLTEVDGGTRLCLVHSGFRTPTNDFAFKGMSGGWPQAFKKIESTAGALAQTEKDH